VAKIGKNGRCPDCQFPESRCQGCTDRIAAWSSSGGDWERRRVRKVLGRGGREFSSTEVRQLLTNGEIG